jgi:hypothetical protein
MPAMIGGRRHRGQGELQDKMAAAYNPKSGSRGFFGFKE